MSDLISRQQAIDAICEACYIGEEASHTECKEYQNLDSTWCEEIVALRNVPSVEPERKKGKWIDDGTELGCCCSECGVTLDDYFYGALYEVRLGKVPNFCPNCGSKMEV